MEDEEEAVEKGNFATHRVYAGFLEGDAARNQVLLLQPLLQEEAVRRALGDLVQWMRH